MCHAGNTDKFLEILGDKLWPVVGDDSWPCIWEFLLGSLQDDLHIRLCHLLSDFPVNNVTTASIEKTAQVIERTAKVDVRNVHMPVFMRLERLNKARTLEAFLRVPLLQQPGLRKNTPGTAGADCDDILIQHHERQPPVSLKRIAHGKLDDLFFFPGLKPKVTGDRGIVFVDLTIAFYPGVKLALCYSKPGDEAF